MLATTLKNFDKTPHRDQKILRRSRNHDNPLSISWPQSWRRRIIFWRFALLYKFLFTLAFLYFTLHFIPSECNPTYVWCFSLFLVVSILCDPDWCYGYALDDGVNFVLTIGSLKKFVYKEVFSCLIKLKMSHRQILQGKHAMQTVQSSVKDMLRCEISFTLWQKNLARVRN